MPKKLADQYRHQIKLDALVFLRDDNQDRVDAYLKSRGVVNGIEAYKGNNSGLRQAGEKDQASPVSRDLPSTSEDHASALIDNCEELSL